MLVTLLLVAATAATAPPVDSAMIYRTVLMRAAPGRLLELIDLLTARLPVYDAAGEERPLMLRHSQGDQWESEYYTEPGDVIAFPGAECELTLAEIYEGAGV